MFSVKKLDTVVGYVHSSVSMYTPVKRFQDSLRTGHVTDGGSAVWRVARLQGARVAATQHHQPWCCRNEAQRWQVPNFKGWRLV